jgi:hypothetical protein
MTILAFVALVAGIGASTAASPGAAYVLSLGVFAGSALWWLFLVTAALRAVEDHAKRHEVARPNICPCPPDLGCWIALGALA